MKRDQLTLLGLGTGLGAGLMYLLDPDGGRHAAALGVGALAGTVGLGLLARNRKVDDLTRPLSGSRPVRGESSAQLEW